MNKFFILSMLSLLCVSCVGAMETEKSSMKRARPIDESSNGVSSNPTALKVFRFTEGAPISHSPIFRSPGLSRVSKEDALKEAARSEFVEKLRQALYNRDREYLYSFIKELSPDDANAQYSDDCQYFDSVSGQSAEGESSDDVEWLVLRLARIFGMPDPRK